MTAKRIVRTDAEREAHRLKVNAERQARWRARLKAELKALRAMAAAAKAAKAPKKSKLAQA